MDDGVATLVTEVTVTTGGVTTFLVLPQPARVNEVKATPRQSLDTEANAKALRMAISFFELNINF
jgi:hypothetical protein